MDAASKLPISAAKEIGDGVKKLRKVTDKVDSMVDIFEFFINGEWTYINNRIYPVISRLSDQEK